MFADCDFVSVNPHSCTDHGEIWPSQKQNAIESGLFLLLGLETSSLKTNSDQVHDSGLT